eukprot:7768843-Alexandrium_andersonii.AAC.1
MARAASQPSVCALVGEDSFQGAASLDRVLAVHPGAAGIASMAARPKMVRGPSTPTGPTAKAG